MVAGARTETMTDLRQFCSRHAAHFGPGATSGTASNSVNASPKQGASLKKLPNSVGTHPASAFWKLPSGGFFDCSAVCHVGSWQQSEHTTAPSNIRYRGKADIRFQGGSPAFDPSETSSRIIAC